jgi:hypothetical protein
MAVTVPNVGFVDIATYYDASIRFASAKKEAAKKLCLVHVDALGVYDLLDIWADSVEFV